MLKNVSKCKFNLTSKIYLFIMQVREKKGVALMIQTGLMTIEDLADYLKVSRRTIYEWLKDNKIPAVKIVGQWRFRKDKIDAWIDRKSLY